MGILVDLAEWRRKKDEEAHQKEGQVEGEGPVFLISDVFAKHHHPPFFVVAEPA